MNTSSGSSGGRVRTAAIVAAIGLAGAAGVWYYYRHSIKSTSRSLSVSSSRNSNIFLENANEILDFSINYKTEDKRSQGIRYVVRKIVGGTWKDLNDNQMEIKVIQGGITNQLYKVDSPYAESVLVRIYGEKTEIIIDREKENRIFAFLSRENLSPTYYGRFKNGRIEGYLESRSLEPDEMGSVNIQPLIARALANYHAIDWVGDKDRDPMLWKLLGKWINSGGSLCFTDEKQTKTLDEINLVRVKDVFDKVKAKILSLDAKSRAVQLLTEVVFSHHDLLSGNILYNENWAEVKFIDYEYGGYDYRGFDIANHWCEYAGFDCNYEKWFPKSAAQKAFLGAYLKAYNNRVPKNQRITNTPEFTAELMEVLHYFIILSHLFWGSWGIIQAKFSLIDFDFMSYAKLRLVDGLKTCSPTLKQLGVAGI